MTLPRILTLVPNLPHVHLGIAKAIQTLAASEEEQKQRLTRAAVDDPKHPGWPARAPDDRGGQFRPKDSVIAPDGQSASASNVRVAMEPGIDPATGQPFSGETPLERLGGGESSSGGGGARVSGSQTQPSVSPAGQLATNRAAGAQFEQQSIQALEQQGVQDVSSQVTIRTQTGVKTRLDIMGRDPSSGELVCVECKSSDTAPLTPNQSAAFPEIGQSGGTVVGQGKPAFPGGTVIPPTRVQIIRPQK